MAGKRARFDLVELAILTFVVLCFGWVGGRYWQASLQPAREGMLAEEQPQFDKFTQRYGTRHNSRNAEEWIIRDFFNDRRDGFFLDVGAAYYQTENNTYYLETALGWRGIAIDAQQEYAADYATHRPQTKFFTLFVSDVSDASVDFYVPPARLAASASRTAIEQVGGQALARRVPTTTLNAILDREHISHVDFVSMDIELAEPKALAGFDVERFKPALVCIEVHPEVRQSILDYFQQHRYVLVARYLPSDHMNLYFMPERTAIDVVPSP